VTRPNAQAFGLIAEGDGRLSLADATEAWAAGTTAPRLVLTPNR
jgi:hypothetical protein